MSDLEFKLLLAGMVLYGISFIIGGIFRWAALSVYMMIGGLAFQLALASVRWADIGHPPIFGTYEAALAASWFLLIFTVSSYRSIHNHYRPLVLTTVPIALFLLVYGFTFFSTSKIPLTISERSLWVDFHALFSWLAFGSYTVSFCLAGVYFWRSGVRSQESEVEKMRSSEDENNADLNLSTSQPLILFPMILDDLIFRYINFGFINHTVMFALGSYYSSILYGSWWQWDLAESTSLITWIAYAMAIHMRLFYGWRGKSGALLSIIAFLTAILSYWGLIYFPPGSTYHVFDLEFKMH